MFFIKKLFKKKDEEKEKKNSAKPSGSGNLDKPGGPFNPIPVPKDPTIKDK